LSIPRPKAIVAQIQLLVLSRLRLSDVLDLAFPPVHMDSLLLVVADTCVIYTSLRFDQSSTRAKTGKAHLDGSLGPHNE